MNYRSSKRRMLLKLAATAVSFGMLGMTASAQGFPDRTITLVVPFAAGGSTDVVARVIAQKMGDELGHQIVVENVAGAGGNPVPTGSPGPSLTAIPS